MKQKQKQKQKQIVITGVRRVTREQADFIRATLCSVIEETLISFDSVQFHIGDAPGVDKLCTDWLRFNRLNVETYHVSPPRRKYSFAQRSMEMVDSAVDWSFPDCRDVIVVGFPNKVCPNEVKPNYTKPGLAFCGSGSGTWATLAYGKGKGLDVVIFPMPDSKCHQLPEWCVRPLTAIA